MNGNSWFKRITIVLIASAIGIFMLQMLFPSPSELKEQRNNIKGTEVVPKYDQEPIDDRSALQKAGLQQDMLNSQIESMTLEEKVGQMFIGGSSKEEQLDQQINLIKTKHFGGLILFRLNVENPLVTSTTAKKIADVQNATKIPLFVAIDEEGGPVTRLYEQLNEQTGQSSIRDINQAYVIGQRRADELSKLGINLNFSPVMDVIQSPDSFMFKRVFQKPHTEIARYGVQMLNGYKSYGVLGVMKHYPGHPDNEIDSHDELPVNNIQASDFDRYVQQFKDPIVNDDVEMLMTSHVKYPNLDPNFPASLSPVLIRQKLRDEYNYDGIVITDDLNMGAIKETYPITESPILAIEAGCDIVMVISEPKYQELAYDTVVQAVRNGRISEERIDESVYRILKLKESM